MPFFRHFCEISRGPRLKKARSYHIAPRKWLHFVCTRPVGPSSKFSWFLAGEKQPKSVSKFDEICLNSLPWRLAPFFSINPACNSPVSPHRHLAKSGQISRQRRAFFPVLVLEVDFRGPKPLKKTESAPPLRQSFDTFLGPKNGIFGAPQNSEKRRFFCLILQILGLKKGFIFVIFD